MLRQSGVDLTVVSSANGEVELSADLPDASAPVFDVKSGRFIQFAPVKDTPTFYTVTGLASHAVAVTGTVTAADFADDDVLFQDGTELSVSSVDTTNNTITLSGALGNDGAPVLVGKSGRFVVLEKVSGATGNVYTPVAATYIPVASATGVTPELSTIFSGAGVFAKLPLEITGGIGGIDLPTLDVPFDFDFALPSLNFGIGGLLPDLPDLPGLPTFRGWPCRRFRA